MPHLLRLIIGPDHRYLLPGSALLGAVLLLAADFVGANVSRAGGNADWRFDGDARCAVFSVAAAARRTKESEILIEVENISLQIGARRILDRVSLELRGGEILAVIGQNGAGKSSLLKILCGDTKPSNGRVLMNDTPLNHWKAFESAKIRAVLPQHSTLEFSFTVAEVVQMGRAPHLGGIESRNDAAIVDEALEAFGVSELKDRIYPTLSGGERQRVQLARVLAQIWENNSTNSAARYLFLDEPISSLDLAHQHQTLKTVRKFARSGVGVYLIIHDLNLTAQYADRVVVLQNGKVLAADVPEKIFTAPLLKQAFEVEAAVLKHPFFDCPLIVLSD